MSIGAFTSPLLDEGQQGEVNLASRPVRIVPGTYQVDELPRFGQKISTGSLKYADFNPEEQAFSIEGFGDGYGLRRYSDVPSVTTRFGNTFTAEDLVARVVKETANVDGRTGPAVLSPLGTNETLPGSTGNVVWLGEFTPQGGTFAGVTKLVAIADQKVFYRNNDGTWTDTGIALGTTAVQGAIGVWSGNLIIGFGAAATAVYTNDLATTISLSMDGTLAVPTLITFGTTGAGGTLTNATAYYYRVSAVSGSNETLPAAEAHITTPAGANTCTVTVRWRKVQGATGYKVYGRSTGAELLMATITNADTLFWKDDGSVTPSGALNASDTTAQATSPYVFAYTSDQAAAYIAGGAATTNTNLVMSSADGTANYKLSSAVQCGDASYPITGLCPGGGVIALVFVGKTSELGLIDTNAVYHRAVPFDIAQASNCVGMRLYLGLNGDAARGPIIVVFPMGDTVLSYTPSSQFQGTTEDLMPIGREGFRPVNARGNCTAIQGTARYLYMAVSNRDATNRSCWIISKNSVNGAPSTFIQLAAPALQSTTVTCHALAYSSLFGSGPILFAGHDVNSNNVNLRSWGVTSFVMPVDGDYTPDDPRCRFVAAGTLQTPDIDIGFPDEPKVGVAIHVIHDNVVQGHQDLKVKVSLDGQAYGSVIGTCNSNGGAASTVSVQANAGTTSVTVADSTGFLTDSTATLVGGANSETVTIVSINANVLSLAAPLLNTYAIGNTVTMTFVAETIIPYSITSLFKRVSVEVDFSTDDSTKTPVLLGLSVRMMLATQVYRVWTFDGDVPAPLWMNGGETASNAVSDRAAWWFARTANIPVVYRDRDQVNYLVRILKMKEVEKPGASKEDGMPYFSRFTFQLLEIFSFADLPYDSILAAYDQAGVNYG